MITGLLALAAWMQAHGSAPRGVITNDDYPPGALNRGEQGTVDFQVVVNPQGSVDSCAVLMSSGSKDLDDATCQIVMTRARFSPAEDDHGKPVYGIYRHSITWRLGNNVQPPRQTPPDVELTIKGAPAGVRLPLDVSVDYFVTASGAVSDCKLSTDSKPAPKELVDLACQSMTQSPIEIVRNRAGQPVDARDSATVRFSPDPRAR